MISEQSEGYRSQWWQDDVHSHENNTILVWSDGSMFHSYCIIFVKISIFLILPSYSNGHSQHQRYGSFDFRVLTFRSVSPNETFTAFCIISVSRATFEATNQKIYYYFWVRGMSIRIIRPLLHCNSKIWFKINVLRWSEGSRLYTFRGNWAGFSYQYEI